MVDFPPMKPFSCFHILWLMRTYNLSFTIFYNFSAYFRNSYNFIYIAIILLYLYNYLLSACFGPFIWIGVRKDSLHSGRNTPWLNDRLNINAKAILSDCLQCFKKIFGMQSCLAWLLISTPARACSTSKCVIWRLSKKEVLISICLIDFIVLDLEIDILGVFTY